MDKHLVCLGYGFSARTLSRRLIAGGWRVTGTSRDTGKLDAIAADGAVPVQWPGTDIAPLLDTASHVLSSVPPKRDGDPAHDVLDRPLPNIVWAGLLSTTGVYGDHGGDWVDEDTPLVHSTHRGGLRADQDAAWMDLMQRHGLPVHRFRLAGIYGPGRSALDKIRDGSARRIVKPGQVFSRIHVEDIATILQASIARPNPGAAYNVADDRPGPPQDVIAFAAQLLGAEVPPDIDFETADLSPMARSFYADNKRVRNDRIKSELGVTLAYPDYETGLRAILAGGG